VKIKIAKYSGFCFGVKRAVKTVFDNLNKNICLFGAIVNNKYLLNDLKKSSVFVETNLDKIDKNKIVIIRAHGVGPNIYDKIKLLDLDFIDCTCPFVKKIQRIVKKNFDSKNKIIIVGNQNHPEIIGINAYANNSCFIIKNIKEAFIFANRIQDCDIQIKNKLEKYICVSQTTFDFKEFSKIKKILENKLNLNLKIYDTICDTTYKRQVEADELSSNYNIVLVIGDETSSNTKKLFDICKKNNKNTFLIEDLADMYKINIDLKNKSIAIIASASTPKYLIEKVNKELEIKYNN
jgi:4-hydroxy-3-methylbut-2-enyl diphosphate reductase